MAPFYSFLVISMILSSTTHFPPIVSASNTHQQLKLSTISAAPAVLPEPPLSSSSSLAPSLSPDIEPEFPKDGAVAPSPSDSSLPTIPSNPSPPNPDDIFEPAAHSPLMAVSPSGSLPASSSSKMSATLHLCLIGFIFALVEVLC